MGAAFVLSVSFNYATLRMYSVLPTILYPFFPTVGILIPCLIHYLVPIAIRANTQSKVLIEKQWRQQWLGLKLPQSRNYMKRKVRAIQPIRFYCGFIEYRLFSMEKSTKITLYSNILSFTTHALVSIPEL